MMKNKKTYLLLLALILLSLLLLLAGCNGDTGDNTSDNTSETVPPPSELVLFDNGICNFRIVYPRDETDAEFNMARQLQQLLREKSGAERVDTMGESSTTGDKYDAEAFEILFSFVDYPEFDEVISQMKFDEYAVCVTGNKIIVTGHERDGFKKAFDAFVAYIEENTVDGKLTVGEGFLIRDNCDEYKYKKLADFPGYPGGKIEDYCDIGDGYKQLTIYDTTEAMYEIYADRLEDAGYELYSSNEIADNLYSTYLKDDEMVYYYYSPALGDTRIILANDPVLPSLEVPTYTKVCEPAYVTLAVYDSSGVIKGDAQGAIIRLEDGSFLIYDGGNNNQKSAAQIFSTLKDLAVDKNDIKVRAWIFSHYHGDHTGTFRKYATTYPNGRSGVHIESFIYNFCNTQIQTECLPSGNASLTNVDKAVKAFDSTVPIYKCLTGQIFHFPGITMEVLATMSDFIPRVIGYETSDADKTHGDGNTMCVVLRIKTISEGNTCMLTGDSTNIVLNDMVDRYGNEYLASDMVTTPHHAHNSDRYRARNATTKFYMAVAPKILIVTSTSASKFTSSYSVNMFVIETFKPTRYYMNEVQLISLSTLEKIQ